MLGRVLARERRKSRADLAGGAVHGGNKSQEQNLLAHGIEWSIAARCYKLGKDFIGRGISCIAVLAVEVRDQFRGGRKCGQDPARCRPPPVFFQAFFVMEFSEKTRLQTADQTIAVASGHHDAAPAPRAVCQQNGPVPYARTWFGEYGGRGRRRLFAGPSLLARKSRTPLQVRPESEAAPAGGYAATPPARAANFGGVGRRCDQHRISPTADAGRERLKLFRPAVSPASSIAPRMLP